MAGLLASLVASGCSDIAERKAEAPITFIRGPAGRSTIAPGVGPLPAVMPPALAIAAGEAESIVDAVADAHAEALETRERERDPYRIRGSILGGVEGAPVD